MCPLIGAIRYILLSESFWIIISFLCVLGLFCGFNLLKIRLVYHVCMFEVYELEDFLGSCVHNLETYVTLGSPRAVGR